MSCPACFQGGVTTSHPTGTSTTIHGLSTYVATPPAGVTPKGIIVFITDAFGWEFVNNRVLCDHYAQNGGFLVYCPDFMHGNAMSSSVLKLMDDVTAPMSLVNTLLQKPAIIARLIYHAVPWKIKASPAKTHPSVVAFLQALRTSEPPSELTGLEGDLKIGVAGFCWGGKHAFMLAADAQESRVVRFGAGEGKMEKERLVDAIFTAHPSYIDVPGDCETVKIPLSVAIGDQDMAMKEPLVRQMKALLEAKNGEGEGEKEYVVEILEGAKHGFAVRTHPEDKREMECAEIAESQAIKWFERWLGSS